MPRLQLNLLFVCLFIFAGCEDSEGLTNIGAEVIHPPLNVLFPTMRPGDHLSGRRMYRTRRQRLSNGQRLSGRQTCDLAAGACSEPNSCTSDDDCIADRYCFQRACRAPCADGNDCPLDSECVEAVAGPRLAVRMMTNAPPASLRRRRMR